MSRGGAARWMREITEWPHLRWSRAASEQAVANVGLLAGENIAARGATARGAAASVQAAGAGWTAAAVTLMLETFSTTEPSLGIAAAVTEAVAVRVTSSVFDDSALNAATTGEVGAPQL